MGLDNVQVMLPFVRTPEEAGKCLAEMATHGLERGVKGLQARTHNRCLSGCKLS
jgi:pyruvate,water dikinase